MRFSVTTLSACFIYSQLSSASPLVVDDMLFRDLRGGPKSPSSLPTIFPTTPVVHAIVSDKPRTQSSNSLFVKNLIEDHHYETTGQQPQKPRFIALALVLFVFFSVAIFVTYFFGADIRRYWRGRLKSEKKESTGVGFGFDGLAKGEKKGLTIQEERAKVWFIKLPAKPPALALKQELPLPPMSMPELHRAGSSYSTVLSVKKDGEF